MKIISIIPLKNTIELLNEKTGEISYYKPRLHPVSYFKVGSYLHSKFLEIVHNK